VEPREDDAPDAAAAVEQYRRASRGYDRHMRRFARWQRMAVERLELEPGDTVIDVACGTGLTFPLIQARVGQAGRIVGIDLSPEMVAQARERVAREGWGNVTLLECAVEDAEIEMAADAALFSFTHDVLQSPRAVATVVAALRPEARVASTGAKLAGRWRPLVNAAVRRSARPYMTTFRGLDRPWAELEPYTGGMQVRSLAFGGAYVACGRITAEGVAAAAERLAGPAEGR
jgi:ubiquinone/menaquinone biosynthesis C-methylase UbiE